MNKSIATSLFAIAASAAFAVPTINTESVKVTQAQSRTVTVAYELRNEPAIVTIDIQTNAVAGASDGWASVGDEHLSHMYGAVNRLVKDTSGTSYAYWTPDKAWPDGGFVQNARAVVTAWATNCPPNYMVIDLATKDVTFYTSSNAVPGGVTDRKYKTTSLVMRKIPAAGVIWNMGSPTGETGRDNRGYETLHPVVITYDYYLSVYEVTQGQWVNMGYSNPSPDAQKAAEHAEIRPVTNREFTNLRIGSNYNPANYTYKLKGHDVPSYVDMKALRSNFGIDFDVPSSAEWEFACRAGEGAAFNDGTSSIEAVGWYLDNVKETGSDGKNLPQPVGLKAPNKWGLYDMHGNVQEFICEYAATVSAVWKEGDPPVVNQALGNESGFWMLMRGGSANAAESACRSAKCDTGAQSFNTGAYNGIRLWAPASYSK